METAVSADQDAFLDRYRTTAPAVYAYLYKACAGERSRVDDLLQETFSAAVVTWKAGKADDVTLPWLLTVARNKLIDAYRKLEREQKHLARAAQLQRADPRPTASDATDALACVRRLPPMQRAVIALRFVDDLPLAEVAAVLGKRVGAVDSLQRRALAALRIMLEETEDD